MNRLLEMKRRPLLGGIIGALIAAIVCIKFHNTDPFVMLKGSAQLITLAICMSVGAMIGEGHDR